MVSQNRLVLTRATFVVVIYFFVSAGLGTAAQHDPTHHPTPPQPSQPAQHNTTDHRTPPADSRTEHTTHTPTQMPPTQMPMMGTTVGTFGSGTNIEPMSTMDNRPSMIHRTLGNWDLMFHANVFVVDVQQTGPRGRDKLFSGNWFMPMLRRQTGAHTFVVRTMLSLEPLTVTKGRYPQLFQTGETAYGRHIVDGQHPHDFFMEVAGIYRYQARERTQFFVYGGPRGEPALGPTAYPHRSSASENPIAVLGHHQQDSTHIADNVITLGVAQGPIQLEASTFRGREPDENRWNFDAGSPDSFASRISIAAGDNWTGQYSLGRINNREALEPDMDTFRMTASLHHNRPMARGNWASSLIWGRNKDLLDTPRIVNAYTLESTLRFAERNWIWGRIENVDRDRTLVLGETANGAAGITMPETHSEEPIGRVQAYTLGFAREIGQFAPWLNTSLGFQLTVHGLPDHLKPIYGNRPTGFAVFLRLRPETSKGSTQTHH